MALRATRVLWAGCWSDGLVITWLIIYTDCYIMLSHSVGVPICSGWAKKSSPALCRPLRDAMRSDSAKIVARVGGRKANGQQGIWLDNSCCGINTKNRAPSWARLAFAQRRWPQRCALHRQPLPQAQSIGGARFLPGKAHTARLAPPPTHTSALCTWERGPLEPDKLATVCLKSLDRSDRQNCVTSKTWEARQISKLNTGQSGKNAFIHNKIVTVLSLEQLQMFKDIS